MEYRATSQSTSSQTPGEALAITDRSLRRLVRQVTETNPSPSAELDKTIRRAKRQLRANKELLGGEARWDDAEAEAKSGE
jgi:hypothetical protein